MFEVSGLVHVMSIHWIRSYEELFIVDRNLCVHKIKLFDMTEYQLHWFCMHKCSRITSYNDKCQEIFLRNCYYRYKL